MAEVLTITSGGRGDPHRSRRTVGKDSQNEHDHNATARVDLAVAASTKLDGPLACVSHELRHSLGTARQLCLLCRSLQY